MKNTPDFEAVSGPDEEQAIVGDAEAKLIASLKRLYVAFTGFGKAMQGRQHTHGRGFVEATDIGSGRIGPNDGPH